MWSIYSGGMWSGCPAFVVITNPGARNEREQLKTKLNTMTGTIRFYEKDKGN